MFKCNKAKTEDKQLFKELHVSELVFFWPWTFDWSLAPLGWWSVQALPHSRVSPCFTARSGLADYNISICPFLLHSSWSRRKVFVVVFLLPSALLSILTFLLFPQPAVERCCLQIAFNPDSWSGRVGAWERGVSAELDQQWFQVVSIINEWLCSCGCFLHSSIAVSKQDRCAALLSLPALSAAKQNPPTFFHPGSETPFSLRLWIMAA